MSCEDRGHMENVLVIQLLQAKECQGLPTTMRHQEEARKDSTQNLRESWPCGTLLLDL
jgi:hypothetical protein